MESLFAICVRKATLGDLLEANLQERITSMHIWCFKAELSEACKAYWVTKKQSLWKLKKQAVQERRNVESIKTDFKLTFSKNDPSVTYSYTIEHGWLVHDQKNYNLAYNQAKQRLRSAESEVETLITIRENYKKLVSYALAYDIDIPEEPAVQLKHSSQSQRDWWDCDWDYSDVESEEDEAEVNTIIWKKYNISKDKNRPYRGKFKKYKVRKAKSNKWSYIANPI